MRLTIRNKAALDAWIKGRSSSSTHLQSIKGPPPKGATYYDGTPIERDVNIGWCDTTTGDVFYIEYEEPN